MKKAFLLASILFISVISTACINNFAVQELNNKAKDFMDKGDYVSAIERLKSSVDLDGSVSYTKAEDYQSAIKTYGDAIKLNPDFADAYYSLAVCEENLAKDIISGAVKVNSDNSIAKVKTDENAQDTKVTLSENAKTMLSTLLNDAISDYSLYQDKSENADDKTYVEEKIKELQKLVAENAVK